MSKIRDKSLDEKVAEQAIDLIHIYICIQVILEC